MEENEPQLVRKDDHSLDSKNGPGITWLLIILVLGLLAGAIAFFGRDDQIAGPTPSVSVSASPEDSHQPRLYTVTYNVGVFSPTNLRIHAGDTVRFKNESIFPIHVITDPHPQHNELPGFDSVGDIPQGSYFSFTFSAKGVFGYHNERDPSEVGTIIVR